MKLVCEGWSSDGTIDILIRDGRKINRYEYVVDAAYIPDWRKRLQHSPGIVLSEIKRTATHVTKLS